MAHETRLFRNPLGEVVGHFFRSFSGILVYETERKPIHFFRKLHGFGISKNIVSMFLGEDSLTGLVKINYKGKRGEVTYLSKIRDWIKFGAVEKYGDFDEQVFLSIEQMKSIPQKKDWDWWDSIEKSGNSTFLARENDISNRQTKEEIKEIKEEVIENGDRNG